MRGTIEGNNRGVIPRCIEQISSTIGSSGTIYVSYLQIYCEIITDLLSIPNSNNNDTISPPIPLSIRERDGCVFVDGLSRYKVSNSQDIYDILAIGDVNRITAVTNINETSSRSHAAIMITIAMEEPTTTSDSPSQPLLPQQHRIRESSLVLVDLAGSERSTASQGIQSY
jgi:hypothetical protein